jgi:hypothetical protein
MVGQLTHIATADCFITLPHPMLECGIVTAWWQSQVLGRPGHLGVGGKRGGSSWSPRHADRRSPGHLTQ